MAGIRLSPEEPEVPHGTPPRPQLPPAVAGAGVAAGGGGSGSLEMASDDERSVAADSWSVRSDYGSTLDDDQRYADAADVLAAAAAAANFPSAASDYCSDKDDQESGDVEGSMLGLQSYWDASYSEDLANFQEHGHAGEIWFGTDVMDTVAAWTKKLCASIPQSWISSDNDNIKCEVNEDFVNYPVLDLGTGNGLLLQALAKQGFSDLTGTDYSEGAIELARNLAARDGFTAINFLVDDVLETKLDRKFKIITDKGTLDAIGLHPDGRAKRVIYWESVSNLVEPGGLVVITSCNHTKEELLQEVEDFSKRIFGKEDVDEGAGDVPKIFHYIDHVQTYPTIMFGGVEGSQVCTVAFQRA
ncbi:EEF1A lysine methyltransferase 2 [Brachypodium distachyon]|nr:EEF1A lysine methyltransferase 2 [Brachypodium distachyon]|eukprot:XP_010232153.1 EEF1A lysine methyltransferase 2 [Brachypodium distachyon]